MAVYAKPSASGKDITAGKHYPVIGDATGAGFNVADDVGFEIYALWKGSCHIGDNDWERVEADQTPADDKGVAAKAVAISVIKQIKAMQEMAGSKEWGVLSYVLTEKLDEILAALHRDAIDQAAAENDALHGKEVSVLGAPWSSPCGMLVGF